MSQATLSSVFVRSIILLSSYNS